MNPYEKGWSDAERGKTLRDCPYHPATGEAIAWRNGWRGFYQSVKL